MVCTNVGPTAYQLEVAIKLGIDVSRDSVNMAGAKIFDEIQAAIDPSSIPRKASLKQIEFGDSIGLDLRGDSTSVASAKIKDELLLMNKLALKRLELKPGDEVKKSRVVNINGREQTEISIHIVSSVGKNLRVYFKGGNGNGAWLSQLEKVTDDN